MNNITYYLIYFLIIILSIIAHEFGHFIVAKLNKVKVLEFGIGFGRCLLSKKIKGTLFKLNLIPFGGYNKLDGDEGTNKLGWLKEKYSTKLFIILGGVIANILIAFICYLINYKSIILGLKIDWLLLSPVFTKDYTTILIILSTYNPNLILLQISFLNIMLAIFNLIPFPALDGGFPILFLFEKLFKDNFKKFIDLITGIGFKILMVAQIIFLIWWYFIY